MPRPTRAAVWLTGLALERPADLAARFLHPAGPPASVRLALLALERRLVTEGLSPTEFCAAAVAATASAMTPAALSDHLQAACFVNAPGWDLLRDLRAYWPVDVISDLPRLWAQPALDRADGPAALYLEDLGPLPDHADLFLALMARGAVTPGVSLWVDHHAPRAAAALQAGLPAALYVTVDRLRRDLGLWGLTGLAAARGQAA